MDDIESCLLVGALFAIFIFWTRWYSMFGFVNRLISPLSQRAVLLILPVIITAFIWHILNTLSSFDVQNNFTYLSFYLVIGLTWVGGAATMIPFFGIVPRDDMVERRNQGAMWAVTGALLGLTFCFSGGNVGDGPGWWAVFNSAGYATVTFFILWFTLELLTQVSQMVTVERDLAAGWRLFGFLTALGIILGRAAAGDWFSPAQMWTVFMSHAWPSLILVAAAFIIERACRPTVERSALPALPFGIIPATLYIGGAILTLFWAGPVL